jgi:hypothetical protein
MGMFDNVNFVMGCPECGTKMTDFQTKEAQCTLGLVEIEDVYNFYTSCYYCGCWVELDRPYVERVGEPSEPKTIGDATKIGYIIRHRKRGEKF